MPCCGKKRRAARAPVSMQKPVGPSLKTNQQPLQWDGAMNEKITKMSSGIFGVELNPNLIRNNTMKDGPKIEFFFAPFIEKWALKPPFVLFHLRCETRQGRMGGIYDGSEDLYYSCELKDVTVQSIPKFLGLDDRIFHTLPVAVMLFESCKLKIHGAGNHASYLIEPA